MKQVVIICLGLMMLLSCDSEKALDCFQTQGDLIEQVYAVDNFDKVRVNRNVELYITQADDVEVKIVTGRNLLNDIKVEVNNGELILSNDNECNFVRDYNTTKAYIKVPDLTQIRCATQFGVYSEGVLNFTNLEVLSEDFYDDSAYAVGDVSLYVNSNRLSVVGNNLTRFVFQGQANTANVSLASGDGTFDGSLLIANEVNVYHRGSNELIVNPQVSLIGEIRSTGNLISKTEPPTVDVEQFYTGQLIFE